MGRREGRRRLLGRGLCKQESRRIVVCRDDRCSLLSSGLSNEIGMARRWRKRRHLLGYRLRNQDPRGLKVRLLHRGLRCAFFVTWGRKQSWALRVAGSQLERWGITRSRRESWRLLRRLCRHGPGRKMGQCCRAQRHRLLGDGFSKHEPGGTMVARGKRLFCRELRCDSSLAVQRMRRGPRRRATQCAEDGRFRADFWDRIDVGAPIT
mmetsp:Transcript_8283/g.22981  ORF Transcript_8283/g.22981 Transcript_8283/m.22981 type:complete len:208 (-) Transcript_8283:2851-3474(-)